MRKISVLLFACISYLSIQVSGQTVSLTSGTYSQDFNTLVNSGTSSVTPAGWFFSESGTNANATYTAGTGSGNSGETYSFGATANSERAFGGLRSGSLVPIIGSGFTNNTGTTISSLTISYTGEQWRAGVLNRNAADRLDFQLSTNAISISDAAATWTNSDALDFNSPNINTAVGALDGNSPANRTAISFTITGLNIPGGATFYIRWTDFDIASSDDGLSIDDFSLSFTGIVASTVSVAAGINAAEPATSGTFNLTLSSPAPVGGITVTYTLAGSATINTDYTDPQAGSVTIAQGNNSAAITLNVNDDLAVEGTETIQLTITGVTSPVTIGTSTATINLNDNDVSPYASLINIYTQDFNTLASTGTSSVVPTGWLFNEVVGNTTYTASTGSSTSGDTYSFGSTSSTERAFGTLASNPLNSTIGAQIQNNSGSTITKLKIIYTGEEWRLGATGRTDKLSFEYSLNATSLTNGTWLPVTNLDFITPNITGTNTKVGNDPENKTSISYTIRNLSIPNGAVFLIRWVDPNISGNDDGLAVDDFTIEANPVDLIPPTLVSLSPANGTANIPINISASIQLNEEVQKGTGNIRLRHVADNSIFQTINITSPAVTVSSSSVNITLSNLEVNTAYYVEIDNGAITDLEGNSFAGISGNSTWAFTTGINIYVANFQTCTSGISDGFTQYSVTGTLTWACTSFGHDPNDATATASLANAVQMNGFSGGTNVPNVDWLISPSFDLTGTNYPLLSFWSRTAFNGQPLQLKISTDYVSGDPMAATWTDINGKFPSQTSNVWMLSENINLSAFKQENVHFAFVYISDDDEGARWTIDDIILGNSPVPPPPSITVSTTDIQFTFAASGTTVDKSFTFIGNDLTNDVTLTANGAFTLSKDGLSFSSSLLYTVAEANNISKTVYVRFAPTQNNQNFTGNISVTTGSLNAAVNLTGTSIDPVTTLEVVNWNVEWFGSTSLGPINDNQQEQNVKNILLSVGADVYALAEIVSEQRLANVVSQMPGYAYVISNYGSHTNTSANPPSALGEAQKMAFIYKTSVLSNINTTALLSQGINSAADLTNPAYNYWASGRFPFMLTADVTLNCITKKVNFILVHAKANTSPTATSYDRRKRGADTLHYTLQQNYANENVIILGDFNDDLDQSITAGFITTSWNSFTTDAVNFEALTLPLSLAGKKSTVSFNDVIDHVVVSNDMQPYYITATANILTDVTSLVTNYASTTSDHYPVFTRYLFENKIAPEVTTCPVVAPLCSTGNNSYSIPLFIAADDCDAVTYSYVITGATDRSGNTNDASGAFNVGNSIITWTATDNWGNSASCQTTVTVNASPTVTIPDAYALPSGVLANTVYIGYSPASSITLSAVASGGTPGYTYAWSSGSTASIATVSPATTTAYTVTITDANGCQASAIKTVNVIDIRGGNKLDKVIICHKSNSQNNSLTIDGNAVATHLAHKDNLGSCPVQNSSIARRSSVNENNPSTKGLTVRVLPNPSVSDFILMITASSLTEKISVRVVDIHGRILEQKIYKTANQTLKIGDKYHPGLYFVEIMQGNEKRVLKLIKL